MENQMENTFTTNELQFTDSVKSCLLEAAKWARFLAILGFIGIGLMLLAGVIMMTSMSALSAFGQLGAPLGGGFFLVVYAIIAIIYYFPIKYLFDFSNKIKQAFKHNNQNLLEASFDKLKAHYKYIGICSIIIMSLYALMFVFGILAAIFSASM